MLFCLFDIYTKLIDQNHLFIISSILKTNGIFLWLYQFFLSNIYFGLT